MCGPIGSSRKLPNSRSLLCRLIIGIIEPRRMRWNVAPVGEKNTCRISVGSPEGKSSLGRRRRRRR
jgi:hypothetical protein